MGASGAAKGNSRENQEGEVVGARDVDQAASTNRSKSEDSRRESQMDEAAPPATDTVISNTSMTVSGEGVSNANEEDTPAVGATTPNINVTGTSGNEASTLTAKAKMPSLNGDSPGSRDQTKDTGVESQVGTQLGSEPVEAEQRPRPKPQPKRGKAKEAGEAPQQLARATTRSQAKNVAAAEMSDGLRSSSRAKVPTEKGAAQSTAGRGRGGARGRGRK
ncbi:hypothetical protein BOTBODRAFT_48914 [Botryobasidium botryosum FD-172 SS1]|uniref:Uncharacterized protein n=1 Tax=Botryobasidium botryosum (strain FD-172 SS1) TaxID=930990 RepID=A0A067LVT7_BOTB1|nr:hypothetical protein BOTBODRAFT_48914 [Botryobasidium botryosum FD-172 SS1]